MNIDPSRNYLIVAAMGDASPASPVRRDVVLVNGLGFPIIAFCADNPGTWFLYVLVARVLIVLVIIILIGTLSQGWSRRLLRRLLRFRKDWLFLR